MNRWGEKAVEIEPFFTEEAERIRRKKISASRRGEMVENVPPSKKSRDQAAKAVGISGKTLSAAVEIEPFFAEEAKKRQGIRTDLREKVHSSDGKRRPEKRSSDQAAKAVGISGKTLSVAKAIKATSPERFEKIKLGDRAAPDAVVGADNGRAAVAPVLAVLDGAGFGVAFDHRQRRCRRWARRQRQRRCWDPAMAVLALAFGAKRQRWRYHLPVPNLAGTPAGMMEKQKKDFLFQKNS